MKAVLGQTPIKIDDEIANLLLYGFGVYSSFIVTDGNMVLGWHYHVERVRSDAQQFLGITVDREAIVHSVKEFIASQEPAAEMTCRITIFPGSFSIGNPHEAKTPKLMVTGRSGSSLSGKPLGLTLAECNRPFAMHKITNIGAAVKERARAKDSGFDDAILTANGRISEGPTWNVFFTSGDKFFTPPNDGKILPGVTRHILIDILGDKVEEKHIGIEDLKLFDGALATNSAIGVVPIHAIDHIEFNYELPSVQSIQIRYNNISKTKIC